MIEVSFVVPAYNEEARLEKTLRALKELPLENELIVVDDGSSDATETIARRYADDVIVLKKNRGKGAALQTGWKVATGTYIACVDADLEESAREMMLLLKPLREGKADFTISKLKAGKKAGFGIVKKRAQQIVYEKTGVWLEAPLSGQRIFHRKWLPVVLKRRYDRFGVETMMNIDLLQAGARCLEVPTNMTHRELGKNLRGFYHRLKQWIDIERQCREVRS